MVFTKAMPAGKGTETNTTNANNPGVRTTFRPPWVKEGPEPLPVPTAPWTLKNARRDSNTSNTSDKSDNNPLAGVQLRKTRVTAKEPQENGNKESTFVKPQLKPVPPKEPTKPPKEKMPPVKLNSVAERQLREPLRRPTITAEDEEIDRVIPAMRNALVREESMRRLSQSQAPAPPPMPPPAPKMPPNFKTEPLSEKQLDRIEQLKARPKNRPDWTAMLKEIESNKKLKHVECNDRSEPLLPEGKAKEHFLYESEKANAHNELLKQIQTGIKLNSVKTNDRSKPMLEGLRKFRRQMTIEEQLQKSMSMASIPPAEIEDEVDEMDDIDKVRDDLQSTKQMLALELRNKETQIRENKRLMSRIQQLEAELEKEKTTSYSPSSGTSNEANEKIITCLKTEAEQARKSSEELEKKYADVTGELDTTKLNLEEVKKQNQILEKKLQDATQGKRTSISDRKDSMANGQESEEEMEEEEESTESEAEDNEEKIEKRAQREIKQLRNKLRNFKNKEDNAKKERLALRDIIKKHQAAMKEEMKKYKQLEKEVNKMAALMKDAGEEEDEDDEEEKDVEEEEEESEEESSEEETETETEEESDSERSQSEDEDAPSEKKKLNLSARMKRHENILAALKKGNFMLKTNAERIQDDLNKQKEQTAQLQDDLDSVLSELG